MTPEEKHKQRLRLKAVTKEQWADAFDDLTEALSSPYLLGGRAVVGPHKRKILVGARTLYGVHSHYNLGTSNVLYHYQADLILALYDCKWRWPEDVSLSDMLIRIACSRIPKAVEKYRKQKEKEEKEGINTKPVNFDVEWIGAEDEALPNSSDDDSPDDDEEEVLIFDAGSESADDNMALAAMMDIKQKRRELIWRAAEGDKKLEAFVQVVSESKQLKDVRKNGGYKPGDTDKLTKRLRRRVIKLEKLDKLNKANKEDNEYGS